MGDGTGCDNMTAVIVRFKPALHQRPATATKRCASPASHVEDVQESAKRIKTSDSATVAEPTTVAADDAASATTT